jgi:hypothetical protein
MKHENVDPSAPRAKRRCGDADIRQATRVAQLIIDAAKEGATGGAPTQKTQKDGDTPDCCARGAILSGITRDSGAEYVGHRRVPPFHWNKG